MTTLITGTVIDETTWNSRNYTPASSVPAVFGRPRSTSRVTLHHWDDPANGPKFNPTCNHLSRPGGNTSAHFVVEAGRVACLVSPEHAAWHAGSAEGNATSIGIECNPRASDADIEEVAALIAWIEDVYGPQEVWLHKEWSPTACPGRYEPVRDRIIDRVNQIRAGVQGTSTPSQDTIDKVAAIRAELEAIRDSTHAVENLI